MVSLQAFVLTSFPKLAHGNLIRCLRETQMAIESIGKFLIEWISLIQKVKTLRCISWNRLFVVSFQRIKNEKEALRACAAKRMLLFPCSKQFSCLLGRMRMTAILLPSIRYETVIRRVATMWGFLARSFSLPLSTWYPLAPCSKSLALR